MIPPINTIKHFVNRTNTEVASAAIANLVIVDAVAQNNVVNTFDVVEGAVVKAVHIEMWCSSTAGVNDGNQVVIIVEKVPANQAAVTVAQILNLQAYPNKKNILFTFQGVLASSVAGATAIAPIRDWLLIPKGKQRFGFGDRLVISISPLGAGLDTCGMFIYKEYT